MKKSLQINMIAINLKTMLKWISHMDLERTSALKSRLFEALDIEPSNA